MNTTVVVLSCAISFCVVVVFFAWAISAVSSRCSREEEYRELLSKEDKQ